MNAFRKLSIFLVVASVISLLIEVFYAAGAYPASLGVLSLGLINLAFVLITVICGYFAARTNRNFRKDPNHGDFLEMVIMAGILAMAVLMLAGTAFSFIGGVQITFVLLTVIPFAYTINGLDVWYRYFTATPRGNAAIRHFPPDAPYRGYYVELTQPRRGKRYLLDSGSPCLTPEHGKLFTGPLARARATFFALSQGYEVV